MAKHSGEAIRNAIGDEKKVVSMADNKKDKEKAAALPPKQLTITVDGEHTLVAKSRGYHEGEAVEDGKPIKKPFSSGSRGFHAVGDVVLKMEDGSLREFGANIQLIEKGSKPKAEKGKK